MKKKTIPKYLFAEKGDGSRQFLVHTGRPPFRAEIFDEPPSAGTEYGLSNGKTLGNFVWPGAEPGEAAFRKAMREADAWLREYDAALETLD